MMHILKSEERGKTNIDWLDSWHSFSFGEYYNPNFMGFGPLRVINEDKVKPANGFPTHPHRNMEIITYILKGALQHKDSIGNGSVIKPGDVQRMSAASGILHSEFNGSKEEEVHLLQIWILPAQDGGKPSYEQKNFLDKRKKDTTTLLASPDGRDGSVTVHQDALMYVMDLNGKEQSYTLAKDRLLWAQVARGEATLNGKSLKQGDGVAIKDEKTLQFKSSDAEIILFDLPAAA